MKKYTIKVGQVFTKQRAKELIEYLKAKDQGLLDFKGEIVALMTQMVERIKSSLKP